MGASFLDGLPQGALWGSPRAAALLFALVPVAVEVPALAALAGVNVLLWAMIAFETTGYGEARHRVRHGVSAG